MENEGHDFLSTDDLRGFGISQLLPVDLEEAASGVEDDALAYLKRVREEAACIPLVITSGIDARAFDDSRTTSYVEADDEVFEDPPYSWMCQVVDDFLVARSQVAEAAAAPGAFPAEVDLPAVTDWQAWHRLMAQESFQPFCSTLARMDYALVGKCLTLLTDGLHSGQAARDHMSAHTGLWLYGLLVRLEKPVHSALAATLRQISMLARKRRPRGAQQTPGSEASALIPVYDTLLVLAGGFFGQDPTLAPLVDEYICLTHNGF